MSNQKMMIVLALIFAIVAVVIWGPSAMTNDSIKIVAVGGIMLIFFLSFVLE